MLTTTLDRMAAGGMYDQLGGGFARYSTDATWLVPHFEKMLYDNAQLAQLYTRAWLVTREDRYRRIATETLEYLLREMRHPEGGFFSSQDADSEGVEGKFFTWSWDELVGLVGEEAAKALGAEPGGNWAGEQGGEREGNERPVAARRRWSPRRRTWRRPDGSCSRSGSDACGPATDDKVLTAWNAMAIQAFAEAGRAFGNEAFTGGGDVGRRVRPFAPARRRRQAPPFLARGNAGRARRTPTTTRCWHPRCWRSSPGPGSFDGSARRSGSSTTSFDSSPTGSAAGSSNRAPTSTPS